MALVAYLTRISHLNTGPEYECLSHELERLRQLALDVICEEKKHHGPDYATLHHSERDVQTGRLTTSHGLAAVGEAVSKPVRRNSILALQFS